jgi:hypothetical protein
VRWISSSKPTGEQAAGTNMFADLNSALANTPPDRLAGVIMLTDGQVHDVPKSAQVLGFDAPVHVLLTGTPDEFDRRIEVFRAPRYGIVGSSRDIELRVVETGRKGRAGERVALKIRREGKADEARAAQIGRMISIPMPFPHAGQNIVEIELETAPGELTAANNRVVVAAEGVRENLRVLLVSGEPHAGERVWRNLLKSESPSQRGSCSRRRSRTSTSSSSTATSTATSCRRSTTTISPATCRKAGRCWWRRATTSPAR